MNYTKSQSYHRIEMRFVALILTFLLFTATVVESYHHHDDGLDHDDCPICVAALHHSANVELPAPLVTHQPLVYPTFFPEFVPGDVKTHTYHIPESRAPPC
jgi:hypothetical protein